MAFEKALFLGGRLINQSFLSSTTEVATLPVSNLQTYQPEKKFRATDNVVTIFVQMPKFVACDACALIGHNATATASVRIKAGTSVGEVAAGGTPDMDSGWLEMWPAAVKPDEEEWPQLSTLARWSNATPFSIWSIEVSDPLNPDPLEFGRLMLDRAFRPSFNIGHNFGIGLILGDVQKRTPFNRIYTDRRGPAARSMALPLNMITKRDLWDNLFTLARLYGTNDDFFVCIDPGETTDRHKLMMQAMFSDAVNFESQPIFDASGNVWRTAMTLVELV